MARHDAAIAALKINPAVIERASRLEGALALMAQTFQGGGHSEKLDGMELGCLMSILHEESGRIVDGLNPD